MATTRQITGLLERHLGVEVAPFAAKLVRDGVLPRRDRPVDGLDAAILLLAVAAAPSPADALETTIALQGAPVQAVHRAITSTLSSPAVWGVATEKDRERVPLTATEAIVEALRRDSGISIVSLRVEQGGASAKLNIFIRGERPAQYRAWYAQPEAHRATGLKRLAEVSGSVITALADAMNPERRSLGHSRARSCTRRRLNFTKGGDRAASSTPN